MTMSCAVSASAEQWSPSVDAGGRRHPRPPGRAKHRWPEARQQDARRTSAGPDSRPTGHPPLTESSSPPKSRVPQPLRRPDIRRGPAVPRLLGRLVLRSREAPGVVAALGIPTHPTQWTPTCSPRERHAERGVARGAAGTRCPGRSVSRRAAPGPHGADGYCGLPRGPAGGRIDRKVIGDADRRTEPRLTRRRLRLPRRVLGRSSSESAMPASTLQLFSRHRWSASLTGFASTATGTPGRFPVEPRPITTSAGACSVGRPTRSPTPTPFGDIARPVAHRACRQELTGPVPRRRTPARHPYENSNRSRREGACGAAVQSNSCDRIPVLRPGCHDRAPSSVGPGRCRVSGRTPPRTGTPMTKSSSHATPNAPHRHCPRLSYVRPPPPSRTIAQCTDDGPRSRCSQTGRWHSGRCRDCRVIFPQAAVALPAPRVAVSPA